MYWYFHKVYAMITNIELNAVSSVQSHLSELEDLASAACYLNFLSNLIPTSFDSRSWLYLQRVNFGKSDSSCAWNIKLRHTLCQRQLFLSKWEMTEVINTNSFKKPNTYFVIKVSTHSLCLTRHWFSPDLGFRHPGRVLPGGAAFEDNICKVVSQPVDFKTSVDVRRIPLKGKMIISTGGNPNSLGKNISIGPDVQGTPNTHHSGEYI